jgi:hypothetical protein
LDEIFEAELRKLNEKFNGDGTELPGRLYQLRMRAQDSARELLAAEMSDAPLGMQEATLDGSQLWPLRSGGRLPTAKEWRAQYVNGELAIPPLFHDAPPRPWKPGFLFGPPGRGKSHRAAGRLKGAFAFDPKETRRQLFGWTGALDGAFIPASELIRKLQEFYADREPNQSVRAIKSAAYDRRFVVLDDLGVSKPTEFVVQEIHALLEYRLNRRLQTLVTSNLDLDGIEASLGERIASRLQAFGPITLMNGKDHRLAHAIYKDDNKAAR